jgi:hypothetical protein
MEWNGELTQIIKEASIASKLRCFSDEGLLDNEQWVKETRKTIDEDYPEDEPELLEQGLLKYIEAEQRLLNAQSRQRIYKYEQTADDLPSHNSLRGEVVNVPDVGDKLLLRCTKGEILRVWKAYGKLAASNNARKERYRAFYRHMDQRGFKEGQEVRELYVISGLAAS